MLTDAFPSIPTPADAPRDPPIETVGAVTLEFIDGAWHVVQLALDDDSIFPTPRDPPTETFGAVTFRLIDGIEMFVAAMPTPADA